MFTDPLSVTYNSVAKSLIRVSISENATLYRTADGEFELMRLDSSPNAKDGSITRSILLTRVLPDPTPSDVFDDFRRVSNTFGITYTVENPKGSDTAVDIPRLRTALLALVDSTLEGRILGGEM